MNKLSNNQVTAVILAGGEAKRLGGKEKGLLQIGQAPLIHLIIESLSHQTKKILISANNHIEEYRQYGNVITDNVFAGQGPLAGIYQALKQAETPYIITLPGDAPYLPDNYIDNMVEHLNNTTNTVCIACNQHNAPQPVYSLIPTSLREDLSHELKQGHNKTILWLQKHNPTYCQFSDPAMFFNINTPIDLENANRQLT